MIGRDQRTLTAVLALVVGSALPLVSAAQENTLTPEEIAAGYILLFDGETLDGWIAQGKPEGWAVEDGAIVNLCQGGGNLYHEDQWDNYVLSLEFTISPGANSGIFFRWKDLGNILNGIEMQILDSAGNENPGRHDCGAIYDIIAPYKNMMKPAGEWNTVEIVCIDSLVMIYMNGEPIAGMDLSRWTVAGQNPDGTPNKFPVPYAELVGPSYIGFQDYGNRVLFRSIKIKPLEGAPGPAG